MCYSCVYIDDYVTEYESNNLDLVVAETLPIFMAELYSMTLMQEMPKGST